MQTITYPNTDIPMIVVQDDGSIYHYNAQGKMATKIEDNRTVLCDVNENEVFEVDCRGGVGKLQLRMGAGNTNIFIDEDNGEIRINGNVVINGVPVTSAS